jgi:hypothetical protein
VKKFKSILLKLIPTATMIMILRTLAFILIIIISYLVFQNWQENISLIGALGILISALLASYSVILNIDTTINLKNREISNQVRNIYFHLCLIKMRLISLDNEKNREKISFMDVERIFDSFEDITKLLNDVKSQEMVSIMHNDMLTDLHMVYLQLSTFQTHLKSLRKSIIPPEKSAFNIALYPNPLVNVNFKIDDLLNQLTNILTYIKDGYVKDFQKDSKGIEACADYFYGMTKQNSSILKENGKEYETTN